MDGFIAFLHQATLGSVAIRLTLATILGGLIGVERVHKRYAAGIRTFALVCLGSALATAAGLYLCDLTGAADIGRIPAGIVSGVSFLGAGTIIVTDRKQVRGLTTAADLWVTSTVGIAIGAGFLWAGLLCVGLVLLTTWLMSRVSAMVEQHTRFVELYIEIDRQMTPKFLSYVREQGFSILSVERRTDPTIVDGDTILRMRLDMHSRHDHQLIISQLADVDGVHYIEENS